MNPREKPEVWDRDWDFILNTLPEFPAAFFKFAAYARERGCLDLKTKELIFFATNSSPTHFFERGFCHHSHQAVAQGATMAELLGVLAVVSTVGAQSFLLGASIAEEEAPNETYPADHAHRVAQVRHRHVELFGSPIPEAEHAMQADPEFYDQWLNLAEVCFGRQCVLTAKVAHLVAIASLAQCTQLCAAGVRQHMRAALLAGATRAELLDVCKLVVGMGGHPMAMGTPLLLSEFEVSEEKAT
jgi:alkylhydroperoxidase/carboxymuconolactone decarboxylase family protein YurZ